MNVSAVQVVADIERLGMGRYTIAHRLGVPRSVMVGIAQGQRQPDDSLGVRLLRLHATLSAKPGSPRGPTSAR